MNRKRNGVCAVLVAALGLLVASPCLAGWQNSYSFGATLKGDLYTPSKLATSPAILVVIHMCSGHSSTVHGWFDSYADTNGFYLIAPDAGKNCFDASASRDGDKAAVVTMVNAVVKLGGDKNRVFATGMSSGGCMTNTLLAIYPDVFAGGSAMPGFPAGTWPAGDTTCQKCGSSPPNNTAQQWGDIARKAFSWSGTYPCVQQWVGGGDQYNFNGYLPAVAAQFTNLLGISGTGTAGTGAPSGWTRTVYKDTSGNVRVETNLGPSSQKHDLETVNPPLYGNVVTFLGLDKPTGACGMTTTSTGDGGPGGTGGVGGGTGGSGGGNKDGGADAARDVGRDASGSGGDGGGPGSGGASGSGGALSSGGSSSNGGASGKGGATGNGGTSGSGGAGSGGTSGGGGTSSAGGTTASGGSSAKGGSSGSGGSSGAGGASSNGGSSGHSSTTGGTTSSGCSFAVGGTTGSGKGLALFLLAAVGLVLRRRRKTRG